MLKKFLVNTASDKKSLLHYLHNGAGYIVCNEIENFFFFEENVNLEFPLFKIVTSKFSNISI